MLFTRGVSGTGAKGFLMLTRYKENINHTDCKNRQIFNLNKTYILLQRRLRVTECNCHWSQSIFHYWNSLLSKAHNENGKRSLFLQEWIYCDPDNTVIYFATFLFIYSFIFFFFWIFDIVGSIIWDMGGLGGLTPQKLWLLMNPKTSGTHLTPTPHIPDTIYDPAPCPKGFLFPPPTQYITKTKRRSLNITAPPPTPPGNKWLVPVYS